MVECQRILELFEVEMMFNCNSDLKSSLFGNICCTCFQAEKDPQLPRPIKVVDADE